MCGLCRNEDIYELLFIQFFFQSVSVYVVLWLYCHKAPCKRIQHCWPKTPNIVRCYLLRPFAHPVACSWMLLRVVAQSLKLIRLFTQQLLTFLLFCDRRSVAKQCWIRLPSSSNIVGATQAHYARFTKTYGLYPSRDALQVPTLLAQLCWELLHPFAHSLTTNILNLER